MQPHLGIRRVRPAHYAYGVSIASAEPRVDDSAFHSMVHCLHDAGRSLGHYFPSVGISVDGQFLGTYPIGRLVHDSAKTANELMGKMQACQLREAARHEALAHSD